MAAGGPSDKDKAKLSESLKTLGSHKFTDDEKEAIGWALEEWDSEEASRNLLEVFAGAPAKVSNAIHMVVTIADRYEGNAEREIQRMIAHALSEKLAQKGHQRRP